MEKLKTEKVILKMRHEARISGVKTFCTFKSFRQEMVALNETFERQEKEMAAKFGHDQAVLRRGFEEAKRGLSENFTGQVGVLKEQRKKLMEEAAALKKILGNLRYFFIFSIIKNEIFAFSIKLTLLGVGFLNRHGAEIGY